MNYCRAICEQFGCHAQTLIFNRNMVNLKTSLTKGLLFNLKHVRCILKGFSGAQREHFDSRWTWTNRNVYSVVKYSKVSEFKPAEPTLQFVLTSFSVYPVEMKTHVILPNYSWCYLDSYCLWAAMESCSKIKHLYDD